MSIFSSRLGFALVLAALCLGGRTAHAQAAPVTYLNAGWPFGFGGIPAAGQNANAFAALDGSASSSRYNFSNGWFVGSEGGSLGLGINGFSRDATFGGLQYQGMQFGYNLPNAGGLPVTVFAGFDTLKYNTGIGSPFAPFDNMSNAQSGYSAHAGVEFKPTSNVSLSLGVAYTQQPDINSLVLPGASPNALIGRR
jgi:hypothetical protein